MIKCGRVHCQFPIISDRIICQNCNRAYHPDCSDLTPEEFIYKSDSNDWICSTCSLLSSSLNTTDERSNEPTIAYVTGNKNKLRETTQILGEKYSGMVSALKFKCAFFVRCL